RHTRPSLLVNRSLCHYTIESFPTRSSTRSSQPQGRSGTRPAERFGRWIVCTPDDPLRQLPRQRRSFLACSIFRSTTLRNPSVIRMPVRYGGEEKKGNRTFSHLAPGWLATETDSQFLHWRTEMHTTF